MPTNLTTALDALSPRAFDELTSDLDVAFGKVQAALYSAERCPYTCGACTQGTDVCRATGHTVS